jgi:integrase
MRGHLEPRGKKTWRAKVFLGRNPISGKQRYLSRTIHGSKREAQAVLAKILAEVGTGAPEFVDGTLEQLASSCLETAEQHLSPSTIREYRRLLSKVILPRFGARKVSSLRAAEIDAFYTELRARGLSTRSIHNVHALTRRLLNQGVRWGWIMANPALRASPPVPRRFEIRPPSPEQVRALLDAAGKNAPDLAMLLRLAAVTGARRGELCALRFSDVGLASRSLTISRSISGERGADLIEKDTKTHSVRTIALDEETAKELDRQRERMRQRAEAVGTSLGAAAHVFSDDPAGALPWRPSRVTASFIKLRDSLGTTTRLHDLRHFAATQLLAAGLPVTTVAGRLGHTDATTTLSIYAHFVEASDREAAQTIAHVLAKPRVIQEARASEGDVI